MADAPDDIRAALTGAARLYVILGDPVAQVRSPEAFNALFRRRAIDAVMVPMRVAPAALGAVIAALRQIGNLDGIVVTVPHKTAMLDLVDEVRPVGRRSGGINAIRRDADGRLVGDSFDGLGFVRGLQRQGHDPKGKSLLVVGAGGAGASIAAALGEAGARRLILFDPAANKARRMVDTLRAAYPALDSREGPPDPTGHDIVVNATPLGMRPGDELPIDSRALVPGQLVADVIMKPPLTALLEQARARGLAIHPGHHMMDGQIAAVAEFFGLPS